MSNLRVFLRNAVSRSLKTVRAPHDGTPHEALRTASFIKVDAAIRVIVRTEDTGKVYKDRRERTAHRASATSRQINLIIQYTVETLSTPAYLPLYLFTFTMKLAVLNALLVTIGAMQAMAAPVDSSTPRLHGMSRRGHNYMHARQNDLNRCEDGKNGPRLR